MGYQTIELGATLERVRLQALGTVSLVKLISCREDGWMKEGG